VDINIPDSDYMILETINFEKNMARTIIVLAITLNGRPQIDFTLGRGQDQDIKMSDITVSRCHSVIKFRNNQFFVDDNLSKFGTLIMIRKDYEIIPGQVRYLQIGKTVICCHLSFQEP
jgi:pSer/pThr/pTyr-binding forkhead associated (FHA) protein